MTIGYNIIVATATMPKQDNWDRQDENFPEITLADARANPDKWAQASWAESQFHQFGYTQEDGYNIKFTEIPNTGKKSSREFVFRPESSGGFLVIDPENRGTFNYIDNSVDPIGHLIWDIIPWLQWGTSETDTNIDQRFSKFREATNHKITDFENLVHNVILGVAVGEFALSLMLGRPDLARNVVKTALKASEFTKDAANFAREAVQTADFQFEGGAIEGGDDADAIIVYRNGWRRDGETDTAPETYIPSVAGGAGDDILLILGGDQDGRPIYDPLEVDGGADDDIIFLAGRADANITGGEGNDIIIVAGSGAVEADGGTGDDFLLAVGSYPVKLFGGAGNDTLWSLTPGSILQGDEGADIFIFSRNTLIADASPEDRISFFGLHNLTGGFKWAELERSWATGPFGFAYSYNQDGELGIWNKWFSPFGYGLTFVADARTGPDTPSAERTAGLYTFSYDISFMRLIDSDHGWGFYNLFELAFGHMAKAMTGTSFFGGVDPLILDLDGDGIELLARTSASPVFDIDADGFAEQTGWVRGGDGFLTLDRNGNGRIDDASEMFGGAGRSGFEALRALDSNTDGVIDANDAAYAALTVWRDDNGDGVTDAGELHTLTALGISAIGLNSTPTRTELSGNVVTATGSFTWADGRTGEIADVSLRLNNYDSVWLGSKAVDPAVAGLANLAGHGTLTDLHIAMTLDTTSALRLQVENIVPTLVMPDLPALRALALPIFTAWAQTPPVAGAAVAKPDVYVFADRRGGRAEVADVAIPLSDGSWALVSGANPGLADYGASGGRTLEQILATRPAQHGAWERLAGAEIAFLQRFMGEEIAIEKVVVGHDEAVAGIEGIIGFMVQRMDALTLRLAAQGPLKSYFDGVAYNVETDRFEPTTARQLIPMFEAIFRAAPANAAGAVQWLEQWDMLLEVMFENFDRGSDQLRTTYAYLFQNIVAAYENVPVAADIASVATALNIPSDVLLLGADAARGTDESDLFYVTGSEQIFRGGAGHDAYVVGRSFDRAVIDDYEPPLATNSNEVVRFAHYSPADLVFTREGLDLVITTRDGVNKLTILEQFIGERPSLTGGNTNPDRGVNEIIFADGTIWDEIDIAYAVSRPDDTDQIIAGTPDRDVLDGGGGNDVLSGGDDTDIYVFGRGYGHDIIEEKQQNVLVTGPDILLFKDGVTREDVTLSRVEGTDDIRFTIDDTLETLTIKDFAAATYTGPFGTQFFNSIELISFSDGQVMLMADVFRQVVSDARTTGDDRIIGFSFEDVLDGGEGDDYLSGGNENDVYIFGRGYGHDTIDEKLTNILSGQEDLVRFGSGITLSDLILQRDGDSADLTILLKGSANDSLTIKGYYDVTETGPFGTQAFNLVETFAFEDGTSIRWDAVQRMVIEQGRTDGDDRIFGTHFDDILDGGPGDDYLSGNDGSDTYIFRRSSGHDTIFDERGSIFSGNSDVLRFEDVNLADLILTRVTDIDFRFALTDGSASVTVLDQFGYNNLGNSHNAIETFIFADGTSLSLDELRIEYLARNMTPGDDLVRGFETDDHIRGGLGDDILVGGDGSDVYHYDLGDGWDRIQESISQVFYADDDMLILGPGITPDETRLGRIGNDLELRFIDGGGVVIERQFQSFAFYDPATDVETVQFADGTIWTWDMMRQMLLDQASTDGDDDIAGYFVADVIEGGPGNDFLHGSTGGDTYIFDRGWGRDVVLDRLEDHPFLDGEDSFLFGAQIAPADLVFNHHGSNLYVRMPTTGDMILVVDAFGSYSGIEHFRFADGTVYTRDTLPFTEIEITTPTDGDDLLFALATGGSVDGGAGNDIIYGSDQGDTLAGGPGRDVLYGNQGGDIYLVDDPEDVIVERRDEGHDIVRTALSIYTLPENVEQLDYLGTIGGQLTGNSSGNTINGGMGDDRIDGRAGRDFLYGRDGNDILLGGAGDDQLDGGSGDDLLFGGDDNDLLLGWAGNDLLDGGRGRDTMRGGMGDDFYIVDDEGDVVEENAGQGYDSVRTSLANYVLGPNFEALETSNDSGVILIGNELDNRITGGTGRDHLEGGDGNDLLIGRGGGDVLTGGAGLDLFFGTAAEFDGATITDLSVGEGIVFSGADMSTFSISLVGETLNYTGGSMTLAGLVGAQFAVRSDPTFVALDLVGVTVTPEPADAAPRGDFNGDGRADVIWRNASTGALSNWLGQPDGGFLNNDAHAMVAGVPASWQVVGIGDFNGDGRADLLWRNMADGALSNWLADIHGGFTPNDANALVSGIGLGWRIAGVGDFNGDGRDDILWRDESGLMSNWLAQANGGFLGNDANAFASVPSVWEIEGVGDFNGDGRDDILWREMRTGAVSNWLGQANGGFQGNDAHALVTGVPFDWAILGTGDFNGDGKDDLLWRNEAGTLANWLGKASGGFTPNDANFFVDVPRDWKVVAIDDYNGDGRDDLLWRNETSGALSDWLGQANGGFTNNDPNAYTVVDLAWQAGLSDIYGV